MMDLSIQPGHLPLQVRFHLRTPYIPPSTGLLHLDALLAAAMVEEARVGADGEPSDVRFEDIHANLPLSWAGFSPDGQRVWCASALRVDAHPQRHQMAFVRKTDADDIVHRVSAGQMVHRGDQINLQSGRKRNFLLRMPILYTKEITAYCIGDKQTVDELLNSLRHLGKKGSQGYGSIQSCEVNQVDMAMCDWTWRQMPHDVSQPGRSYVPVLGRVAPPYWDKTGYSLVWAPHDAA